MSSPRRNEKGGADALHGLQLSPAVSKRDGSFPSEQPRHERASYTAASDPLSLDGNVV